MQRSHPQSRFALFRCPVCRRSLAQTDRSLVCPQGHSFDLARSGYVNLRRGRRYAPSSGGDTRAQLARRDAFLAKGYFDFIAEAIAAAVEQGNCPASLSILDAGCGTGFHLGRISTRLACRITAGAGLDISKDAAAWCARRHPNLAFAVADVWEEWPVHGASIDLVLSIFAPRNFAEAARVLRPGGLLAVAFPGARHFIELRQDFDLLGLSGSKAQRYTAELGGNFDEPTRRCFVRQAEFSGHDIWNAIMMGPHARHMSDAQPDDLAPRLVTIDIELLLARRARWEAA